VSAFTKFLNVTPLGEGKWRVDEAFEYHVGYIGSNVLIRIEAGTITDLASTPVWFKWINKALLTVGLTAYAQIFTKRGNWDQAAVVHDHLYSIKVIPRIVCDLVFLEAMKVRGETFRKRWYSFIGVRLGGWYRWHFPQY
jgi:hypothetical protein